MIYGMVFLKEDHEYFEFMVRQHGKNINELSGH